MKYLDLTYKVSQAKYKIRVERDKRYVNNDFYRGYKMGLDKAMELIKENEL